MGERSRELVAYHEAEHAVAAYTLGIEVEGVSIMEDAGSLGRSTAPLPENFDPSNEGADAILENHLITGVAGAASEELLTGELSELTGKDLAGVAELLMGLADTGAPVQAESEEALDKAKSILRDNCGSVQALAEALLECEELEREGLMAVLERTKR